MRPPAKPRPVPWSELASHGTEHSCWMAIRGVVYDVTPYLRYHPAGVDEIMRGAGDDATLLFQEYHAWVNVTAMLKPCIVGPLEPTPAPRLFECTLEYGGSLSPDCHWIRLRGPGLAEAATAMHAPWHVKLRVASEQPNRELERPYTPLAMFAHSNDCLELVVKAYSRKRAVSWLLTHSGVEPRSALVQLRQAASPWRDKYSKLGMVCNGTGVLPLLQVLREAFERGVNEAWLVCANRTPAHALWRTELAALTRRMNVHVIHVVSSDGGEALPDDAAWHVGRFNPDMIESHRSALPSVEDADGGTAAILICGTWAFMSEAKSALFLAGFPAKALYKLHA